jgi:homoserine kinase type II
MAVFTPVSQDTLVAFLADFDLGELAGFEGISAGIENTNYFVDTTHGRFVLTLFEKLTAEQLPFYLQLMRHLADRRVPCPRPMANRKGQILLECEGKPASLATRLKGSWPRQPTARHCELVGQAMAKAHIAVADYPGKQLNLRGLSWWKQVVPELRAHVLPGQATLLEEELDAQCEFQKTELYARLPKGAVHADLFRDNVLFEETSQGPELGGFIDFYFAGVDTFVFDLAVAANDWCIHHEPSRLGQFDFARLNALLQGYQSVRMQTVDESRAWPMALRAAAFRFWVSRLYDWHLPRAATMLTPKDPTHFEQLLTLRRHDITLE